ncbi:MAG: rod-binding protein [Planctomycetota bacterium]
MSALNPLGTDSVFAAGFPAPQVLTRPDGEFDRLLSEQRSSPKAVEKGLEAAEELVATAFILPVLSQVRNDPFKSDLFDGGRAEAAFGQQLDVIFANNIARAADFGISEKLVGQAANATQQPEELNVLG